MAQSINPETTVPHSDYRSNSATNAVAVPIYQTASYEFESTEYAADLFALKQLGNIYGRLTNPTCDVLEQRITALEGGAAALAVSSGQAATVLSIQNIAGVGDTTVSSTDLYGSTWNLFANTFKTFGIEVHFFDPSDLENFRRATAARTRAYFAETLPLRMREHCKNAQAVGEYLAQHPAAKKVIYPGLQNGKNRLRADQYFTDGYGDLIGFKLIGGREAGQRFIDALQVFCHVANIGDVRSLAIHLATTTHQQLTAEQQLASGVTDRYLRLSVGIEQIDDLPADLGQALATCSDFTESA